MFEAGDRARVKSGLRVHGRYGEDFFVPYMSKLLGKKVTITGPSRNNEQGYEIKEDAGSCTWTDEMLEPIKEDEEMRTYRVDELIEGVEYKDVRHGELYKKEDSILYYLSKHFDEWREANGGFNQVMRMEFIEREFEPKFNETYYFPLSIDERGYGKGVWHNSTKDYAIKLNTGIYRTPEQAINAGKKDKEQC